MIINIIRDFLLHYRKGLSIEILSKLLANKNIKDETEDILKKSEIFKLHNGIIFLKSTLIKTKKEFLKEFNDYLTGKILNKNLRDNIINIFIIFLPDSLFLEWLDVSLERRIIIFDLLFNMIFKQENKKDRLKTYFNDLIEFYSIVVIFSILLSEYFETDYENFITVINEIEPFEEILKMHLFNILTLPDIINSKINNWYVEFKSVEKKLISILESNFTNINHYSPKLFKRVIKNELKEFDILLLLSRFEYKKFYDWLTTIIEEKSKSQHNLFDDLGL